MRKYVAYVGIYGTPVTQKQLDKWKKGFTDDEILNLGEINKLLWYIIAVKPNKALRFFTDRLNKATNNLHKWNDENK